MLICTQLPIDTGPRLCLFCLLLFPSAFFAFSCNYHMLGAFDLVSYLPSHYSRACLNVVVNLSFACFNIILSSDSRYYVSLCEFILDLLEEFK